MMEDIKNKLIDLIKSTGTAGDIVLTKPPKPEMGDLAFGVFALAKEQKKNPAEAAKDLVDKIKENDLNKLDGLVEKIEAFGPYVNFFLNSFALANEIFNNLDENFGKHNFGEGKKYLVEYGCPNPMKAFHLGHLRNLISGESVCRILENAGYSVVRINYQGDVGLHIPKVIYALQHDKDGFNKAMKLPLNDRVQYLGQAYAKGSKAYEDNPAAKEAINDLNKKVYARDESIKEIYDIARGWSLEYFDTIYTRLGTKFDELYFESEVWERGVEIVQEFLKKKVFKESEGAIIFAGSKHGLHDRVFITSKGTATYEAKDLALSERRFKKHTPDKIIHVVGKEQTEYFRVVFKALEEVLPETKDKEFHLIGGFLQLKEGKMSSRTGNVVLGEHLLNQSAAEVGLLMKDREIENVEEIIEKVAMAAVKYSILKVHVSSDIAFDVKKSVSLEGDSGPYLLYIVARINSILRRPDLPKASPSFDSITSTEKEILLSIAAFPEITKQAATDLDPSKISHYLLNLAQQFNTFYHESPIVDAEDQSIGAYRLMLSETTLAVMEAGLNMISIDTVAKM